MNNENIDCTNIFNSSELRKITILNAEILCLGPFETRKYFSRNDDVNLNTICQFVDAGILSLKNQARNNSTSSLIQLFSNDTPSDIFSIAMKRVNQQVITSIGIYWDPIIYSIGLQKKWITWAKTKVFKDNITNAEIAVDKAFARLESCSVTCKAINMIELNTFCNHTIRYGILDEARRMHIIKNSKPPLQVKNQGELWCQIWDALFNKNLHEEEIRSNASVDVTKIIVEIKRIKQKITRRIPKERTRSILAMDTTELVYPKQREIILFTIAMLLEKPNNDQSIAAHLPVNLLASTSFKNTTNYLNWFHFLGEKMHFTTWEYDFLYEHFVNDINLSAITRQQRWADVSPHRLRYLKHKLLQRFRNALNDIYEPPQFEKPFDNSIDVHDGFSVYSYI